MAVCNFGMTLDNLAYNIQYLILMWIYLRILGRFYETAAVYSKTEESHDQWRRTFGTHS